MNKKQRRGAGSVSDYDSPYSDVLTVDDEQYLMQDGELFDEPLIRSVDELLECERDEVQLMYLEDDCL